MGLVRCGAVRCWKLARDQGGVKGSLHARRKPDKKKKSYKARKGRGPGVRNTSKTQDGTDGTTEPNSDGRHEDLPAKLRKCNVGCSRMRWDAVRTSRAIKPNKINHKTTMPKPEKRLCHGSQVLNHRIILNY